MNMLHYIKISHRIGAVAIVLGCFATMAGAQQRITLHIGDTAPALHYSNWIKGTPVDITRGDKLYVIELWATWCGPCKAAMPHLSALAQQYAEKAVFIGCNVLELVGDRPYESALPAVEHFVRSSSNNMNYQVIMDNNDQHMANKWLRASGQTGIPATFVVKNNQLVWTGHPTQLDSVMVPLINGTFDMVTYKEKIERQTTARREQLAQYGAALKAVNDAVARKDFEHAFRLIDGNSAKLPMVSTGLKTRKFEILLTYFGEARAFEYAAVLIKEKESAFYKPSIAGIIAAKEGLSSNAYQYAATLYLDAQQRTSLVLDKAAMAQSKAGDFLAAVATAQQAVEQAKREVNDPAFNGRVPDATITHLQEKVDEYKKKAFPVQ